jgi:DNA-binding response OmpR family regulator
VVRTVRHFHPNDEDAQVATIRWPDQGSLRDRRIARGEPCLLLIEPDIAVPETDAFLEDWTLTTASPIELKARREALLRRVAALPDDTSRNTNPTFDLDDVLRVGDRSLILAPIEVRLLRVFLASPGSVLSRDTLTSAVWPDGAPRSNSFGVRLAHLRKRLTPLGLSILTFPNHGYMLELPE